jgi:hypothetical protein
MQRPQEVCKETDLGERNLHHKNTKMSPKRPDSVARSSEQMLRRVCTSAHAKTRKHHQKKGHIFAPTPSRDSAHSSNVRGVFPHPTEPGSKGKEHKQHKKQATKNKTKRAVTKHQPSQTFT